MTPFDDMTPNADLSLSLAGPTTIHRGEVVSLRLFVQAVDRPVRGVTFLAVLPSAFTLTKLVPPPNWTIHAFNIGSSLPAQAVRLYGERTGWVMPGQVEEIRLDLTASTSPIDRYAVAVQLAVLSQGIDNTPARVMWTPLVA